MDLLQNPRMSVPIQPASWPVKTRSFGHRPRQYFGPFVGGRSEPPARRPEARHIDYGSPDHRCDKGSLRPSFPPVEDTHAEPDAERSERDGIGWQGDAHRRILPGVMQAGSPSFRRRQPLAVFTTQPDGQRIQTASPNRQVCRILHSVFHSCSPAPNSCPQLTHR